MENVVYIDTKELFEPEDIWGNIDDMDKVQADLLEDPNICEKEPVYYLYIQELLGWGLISYKITKNTKTFKSQLGYRFTHETRAKLKALLYAYDTSISFIPRLVISCLDIIKDNEIITLETFKALCKYIDKRDTQDYFESFVKDYTLEPVGNVETSIILNGEIIVNKNNAKQMLKEYDLY